MPLGEAQPPLRSSGGKTRVSPQSFFKTSLKFSLAAFCLALPLSIAGSNIAWGLVSACLVGLAFSGMRLPFSAIKGELFLPLLAYFAVVLITSLLGVDPGHSVRFLNQDLHKLWIYSLLSIAVAVEPLPEAPLFLATGFLAAAVVGLVQPFRLPLYGNSWARAHAFVHPVTFGEQAAIACLGAFCFLKNGDPRTRKAAWSVLIVGSAALILSQTQMALIAFIVGAAAVSLFVPRWRSRLKVGVPVAAATIFVVMMLVQKARYGHFFLHDLRAYWTGMSGQNQLLRLTLWKIAWRMGLDHPWTGVGLNNYRAEFSHYFSGLLPNGEKNWGTAHNVLLHHFAERGVFGVLAVTWLFIALGRGALRRVKEAPEPWNLWSLATVTAFGLMNLTEVALQDELLWMLVFFIWLWTDRRHREPLPL